MRQIQLLGLMTLCTILALGCGKKVPSVTSVSPSLPAVDAAPPPAVSGCRASPNDGVSSDADRR